MVSSSDLKVFQKKKGSQDNLIQKAQSYFDENIKQRVGEQLMLLFPLEVRSFFESQTSKNKTTLRSQLLNFERSMHCFSEVEQFVTAYKVNPF